LNSAKFPLCCVGVVSHLSLNDCKHPAEPQPDPTASA
jgi:hypothetical protein